MGGIIYFTCIITLLSQNSLISSAYTLTPSQSLSDGQTLVSQSDRFELGFFSPSPNNSNRYLGVWYKTIPVQTVVWVANRESPVPDTSGVLKIDRTGNIVIVNATGSIFWSSNSSRTMQNPIAEFLESGNIVLRDATNGDRNSSLWQSFDYPSDTLLPGMKFGMNFRTGISTMISSWRNSDDPSHGDFTYGMEYVGYPQIIMRKGSEEYYRSGLWNGISNTGSPYLRPNSMFTYEIVLNAEETYFIYHLVNQSILFRTVVVQTGNEGEIIRYVWVENGNSWVPLLSIPRDTCHYFAQCGPYSTCDPDDVTVCKCLEGFKPKSRKDWSENDWSQGCEREVPLNCSLPEGFRKYTRLKLPETSRSWYNLSTTLEECRIICLNNCSCLAYTNAFITNGGTGCVQWFTDLIDIKQFSIGGQDLYVRMPSSELDSEANSRPVILVTIVTVISVSAFILLSFGSWYVWKKRGSIVGSDMEDIELPLYSLATIDIATNNFSADNKLGEGGFGPVYKGSLEGQEIAVKRLSKGSTQGVEAFKNEVILISKLQHRNLVRLLGCCIEKEEKMLLYEYMPNKSLDSYIFDETKRRLLDWPKRFQIIQGIAGGLHYLHHYSRLRIIHRDLKASNVLLNNELVPKISDFGMARIFGDEQVEARTRRVVGTYGYMAPEYMVSGYYSAKSDVFSFGVLVLEIISGNRNWRYRHSYHEHNLVGHAWTLCEQDRSLEFVDESIRDSVLAQDVLRCIHIGLLCVQKEINLRPTMSSVVMMLSSETAVLPRPEKNLDFFWKELLHKFHLLEINSLLIQMDQLCHWRGVKVSTPCVMYLNGGAVDCGVERWRREYIDLVCSNLSVKEFNVYYFCKCIIFPRVAQAYFWMVQAHV